MPTTSTTTTLTCKQIPIAWEYDGTRRKNRPTRFMNTEPTPTVGNLCRPIKGQEKDIRYRCTRCAQIHS